MSDTITPAHLIPGEKKYVKKMVTIGAIVVTVLVIIFGIGIAYAQSFSGRVFPGVRIGQYSIGGMTDVELTAFIEQMEAKLLAQGIPVTFDTTTSVKEFVLYPQSIGEDMVSELIEIDAPLLAREIISQYQTNNFFRNFVGVFTTLSTRPSIDLGIHTIHKDKLFAEIDRNVSPYITPMVNANVSVSSVSPLEYEITSSSRGTAFDYNHIVDQISEQWARLEQPHIRIVSIETDPLITESDVERIIETLPQAFDRGALTVEYFNSSTKRMYTWKLNANMLARMLEVVNDEEGDLVFGLSPSSTYAFLRETVAPDIDIAPQDARFIVGDDGRVTEFHGSHPGLTVDVEATYEALREVFASRFDEERAPTSTQRLTLRVKEVEPDIKTADVNDLGITEVLGVGQSVFKGSPGNRYKNIRHAAFNKLNGLIIKPGENFSLLNALKPFTLEGGYLPELTIKGDRLVPEIGGGLCQIGTTMFRAAMNAGLEITERRNHSLMISYYNDLTNGLPGTDATIYDPGTDFRFRNDTGHHILITSELNDQTGDLFFTLWGTSDGRKGYFIPPTVSRRMPAGPTKIIETTELPPGKKECQHAYPGAVASFTYVRELPTGEKKEVVYDSYYRPLPETCLVGVAKKVEEGVSSSTTSTESIVPVQPIESASTSSTGGTSPLVP